MGEFTNIDNLQTLIILALDSYTEYQARDTQKIEVSKRGTLEVADMSALFALPDKAPTSSYTFDSDGGRIYGTTLADLLYHPFDLIGQGQETIILSGDRMKWLRVEPIARPKKCLPAQKADKWFAMHYRETLITGQTRYNQSVIPMTSRGRIIPFAIDGWGFETGNEIDNNAFMVYSSLSVIEDAHRAGCMLATVSAGNEIKFPIPYGAQKDFAALREGPRDTPTGRRNPIIHFCEKHLRRTRDNETEVKGHWRGTDTVTIEGMTLTISTDNRLEYNIG